MRQMAMMAVTILKEPQRNSQASSRGYSTLLQEVREFCEVCECSFLFKREREKE